MTNIIMTVYNRHRLTEQALQSLFVDTDRDSFNLTVVDDGSDDFRVRRVLEKECRHPNCTVIRLEKSKHILGMAKNIGAEVSYATFGPNDFYCFLDNDVYLLQDWLDMLKATLNKYPNVGILGGCRHPYHGINEEQPGIEVVDAVAGYCMFMCESTWREYGPFYSTSPGVGQSEDSDLCRRVQGSFLYPCAYITPPVLSHTGITNSEGNPATGSEAFTRLTGVLYE